MTSNRIERAARLARHRSSTLIPFSDSFQVLRSLREDSQRAIEPKPVVYSIPKKEALLAGKQDRSFLFQPSSVPIARSIDVTETEYAEIHTLDPSEELAAEYRIASIRSLAAHHADDPIILAHLAHVSIILDMKHHCQFCSRCGAPRAAGMVQTKLICLRCKMEKYPRQSPCAIVFVHDPWSDSVLLGRRTPGGIWSLLAGFCESLESLENCAVREVKEESGIDVDRSSVEICATQPWPFFSERFEGTSLMVGCFAKAARPGQTPIVNADELDAVEWLPITELEHRWSMELSSTSQPLLPFKASMARFLMHAFLDCKTDVNVNKSE